MDYWERKSRYRTYELTPELISRIDTIAADLDIYQSELVRYLLTDAINRLDRGELKLEAAPRKKTHRLNCLPSLAVNRG